MPDPSVCDKCGDELVGELGVTSEAYPYGVVILIGETSKRNWIACDACNAVVCHKCCHSPHTGYCNKCLELYQQDQLDEEYMQKILED